jgi:hypothetical protein
MALCRAFPAAQYACDYLHSRELQPAKAEVSRDDKQHKLVAENARANSETRQTSTRFASNDRWIGCVYLSSTSIYPMWPDRVPVHQTRFG